MVWEFQRNKDYRKTKGLVILNISWYHIHEVATIAAKISGLTFFTRPCWLQPLAFTQARAPLGLPSYFLTSNPNSSFQNPALGFMAFKRPLWTSVQVAHLFSLHSSMCMLKIFTFSVSFLCASLIFPATWQSLRN